MRESISRATGIMGERVGSNDGFVLWDRLICFILVPSGHSCDSWKLGDGRYEIAVSG